jgi:hypothetical protein
MLSGPEVLLEADQLSQRGQELGGCGDEKYATMGEGIAELVMI